ncbi:DUF58 domain-containing protein [Halostella sp. JP-L12]|uniref:DUF58 domain-containing protein n=1 Tax=Halostella TaxID=1843185 RepID=UPI000EF78D78|nr:MULTISPECIES: DUF58 domain-containing protein [Halostella]NHN49830.1 DUF58 domain-containing protein [Halostella sp. JP-L12]
MTATRTTDRWRGVVAVTLFAGAVGVFGKRPYVLLCAIVGVVYAVYPRVSPAPTVDLEIERVVSDAAPGHGEPAEVTVTVRNVGDATLPDLRIVDGVPPMLPVTGGSARHAAVLRPGASTTFSYEVTARRGTHRFEAATVIARDISGMHEVETTVSTDTEIECHAAVPEVPLRAQTQHRTGRIVTDEGGSGIEFQQTREYRAGDPMSRVDWNRYARTGTLTTVEYREERSASVLLCLDARAAAYRARGDDRPHAVSYCVAAAQEMLSALIETRDRVGLAAVGRELLWLAPGTGADHGNRARRLLATHPTLSMRPPEDAEQSPEPHAVADGGEERLGEAIAPDEDADGGDPRLRSQVTELRKRLDGDTQVILLSPLPDDGIVEAALSLEAGGNAVTVVSPDVTTAETVGGRLARVERDNRVHSLHQSGVPVIDWDPDRPLGTVLLRAAERWSA